MTTTESSVIGEVPRPGSEIVTDSSSLYQLPLERLSKADPANVQEIAATQIQLLAGYHQEVLDQAKKSFFWALVAAIVGLAFFLFAILALIIRQSVEVAIISAIGGALIEFISAINFYLYGKTASQMADYQERLDRTQRFLLANSMCESLTGEYKQNARSELIKTIAGFSFNPDSEVPDHPNVE